MAYPLWQAETKLLQLHEQLAIEKLQELARYDLVGEVRRAIGSTLESGETTLETVASQLSITPRRYEHGLVRRILASSKFCLIIAAVWQKTFGQYG